MDDQTIIALIRKIWEGEVEEHPDITVAEVAEAHARVHLRLAERISGLIAKGSFSVTPFLTPTPKLILPTEPPKVKQ